MVLSTLLSRPTRTTSAFLVILYLAAMILNQDKGIVPELMRFTSLAFGYFSLFFASRLVRKPMKPRSANTIITILILALLSHSATPLHTMFFLGLTTALIKTIIRTQHHPIFNPAAAGLFILSFFGLSVTWWGTSFAPRFTSLQISLAALFTISIGSYIAIKFKKLPTLISSTASFTISFMLLTKALPLYIVLEGTFAFFLLIMATEPKTTPVIDTEEWIHGTLLGVLLAFLFSYQASLPYLTSLLIVNLAYSLYKLAHTKIRFKRTAAATLLKNNP